MPRSWAYFTGRWETIDFLVENGATLNARLGPWPLLKHACQELRFAEAIRFIELGVDVYASFEEKLDDEKPLSALRCCCLRKDWRKEAKHMDLNDELGQLRAKRQQRLREEAAYALIKADRQSAVDLKAHWFVPLLEAAFNHLPMIVSLILVSCKLHHFVYLKEELLSAVHCALESKVKCSEFEMLEILEVTLEYLPQFLTNSDILQAIATTCGNNSKQKDRNTLIQMFSEQVDAATLNSRTAQNLWGRAIENGKIDLCRTLSSKGLKPTPKWKLGSLISKAFEADCAAALEYIITFKGVSETILTGPRLQKAIADQRTRCAAFLMIEAHPLTTEHEVGRYACFEHV